MKVSRVSCSHRRAGTVLFEVLLALLIFGVVAVALARSLASLGNTVIEVGREVGLRSRAHSLLWQHGFNNEVVVAKQSTPDSTPEEHFTITVAPAEERNQDGATLAELFRITVHCEWLENGRPREFTIDTLRYAPLYR